MLNRLHLVHHQKSKFIMKKFFSVIRVSTKKQFAKGSSILDQERVTGEYAQKLDGEIVGVAKIQVSGKAMVMNAGQLAKALSDAHDLGAEIIVTKLDRLSRDQITLLQLKKASQQTGVEIHIASMGRAISEISDLEFTLLASFAEQERKTIAQRIKDASRGKVGPIGRELDAKVLGGKSARVRIGLAHEWAESVGLKDQIIEAGKKLKSPTLKNVSTFITGNGMVTRSGNPWSQFSLHQQIKRLGWDWKGLVS